MTCLRTHCTTQLRPRCTSPISRCVASYAFVFQFSLLRILWIVYTSYHVTAAIAAVATLSLYLQRLYNLNCVVAWHDLPLLLMLPMFWMTLFTVTCRVWLLPQYVKAHPVLFSPKTRHRITTELHMQTDAHTLDGVDEDELTGRDSGFDAIEDDDGSDYDDVDDDIRRDLDVNATATKHLPSQFYVMLSDAVAAQQSQMSQSSNPNQSTPLIPAARSSLVTQDLPDDIIIGGHNRSSFAFGSEAEAAETKSSRPPSVHSQVGDIMLRPRTAQTPVGLSRDALNRVRVSTLAEDAMMVTIDDKALSSVWKRYRKDSSELGRPGTPMSPHRGRRKEIIGESTLSSEDNGGSREGSDGVLLGAGEMPGGRAQSSEAQVVAAAVAAVAMAQARPHTPNVLIIEQGASDGAVSSEPERPLTGYV